MVFLAGTGPNNLDRNLQQDPNNDRFIVMHIHFRRKNKNFGIRQINFRHGTELRKVRGGSNPIVSAITLLYPRFWTASD